MKFGLLSTLHTNIGDDLIRRGIIKIITSSRPEERDDFLVINKHRPLSIYPLHHPARWLDIDFLARRSITRKWAAAFARFGPSKFDDRDILIQCGTPVFWEGCYNCEWRYPVWEQVMCRLSESRTVMNLAAGSCYRWEGHDMPAVLSTSDLNFMQKILNACSVTTVRDVLAQQICSSLGYKVPIVPCAASLAFYDEPLPNPDKTIMINFMDGGGHFDWDQGIDKSWWIEQMRKIIAHLSSGSFRITFLCHDAKEYRLSGMLFPGLTRIEARSTDEFKEHAAKAHIGICNRLHAAVGMAGLGVPSIAIGTDTRGLMAEAAGIEFVYVKDAAAANIISKIEKLIANRSDEHDRLLAIRQSSFTAYRKLLDPILQRGA
jgi:hypothetical protein